MNTQVLLTTKKGITYTRTDMKKRSKVEIRNKDGYLIDVYRFDYLPDVNFKSPFISWENLNCLHWNNCDEDYIYNAVQNGKKLCAGVGFGTLEEANRYAEGLDSAYHCYRYAPMETINGHWYNVDVLRKGRISDYIDIGVVEWFYLAHKIDFVNFSKVRELCDEEMLHLVDGSLGFDYGDSAKRDDECVVTGLLLGYPLESTIWFMLGS